jgi:hypothetical protein
LTTLTVGRWSTNANAGHVDVGVDDQREGWDRIQGRDARDASPIRKARRTCLVSLDTLSVPLELMRLTMGKENPVGEIESRATIGFAAVPEASKQKGASEATRSIMPATRIKAGKLLLLGGHRSYFGRAS